MYFFIDDIHLDDTSSGEQTAVFRDLDTYLDAQLMNINFLGVPDCRLVSYFMYSYFLSYNGIEIWFRQRWPDS